MLEQQMDSSFLSADAAPGDERNKWFTLPQKPPSRRHWWFSAKKNTEPSALQQQLDGLLPTLRCEAASLPKSEFPLENHPLVQQADIINLHWVAGILDYPSFFVHIDKPVVWTLHDMQPFSGIFHYENDLKNNPQANGLDQTIRTMKQEAVAQRCCPLHIVSPSDWLLQKAVQSSVFEGLKGTVIPYSLDLKIFAPANKMECRKSLGLPMDKHFILFISKHLTVARKGWVLFHEAMNRLNARYPNWAMIAIGCDKQLPASRYERILPGNIEDDQMLAKYYAAADVVAVTSLEDNLPNVMLEALACGRPVVSFNNGGMKEHIFPELTGWIGDAANIDNLLMESFESHHALEEARIRQYAEDNFNQVKQVAAYQHIYHQMLSPTAL